MTLEAAVSMSGLAAPRSNQHRSFFGAIAEVGRCERGESNPHALSGTGS
jgi:hypothetical protein